jgi:glycosyltransferase involved in cell wall biosynthesis
VQLCFEKSSVNISIFVPTYNRLNKLIRLIDSLDNQTFESWNLIVIDDGSNDGTAAWLEECSHPKISKILHNENKGHPAALFNAAICDQLEGDLVIFIGSDDYFYEASSLEKIVETVKQNNQNVWKFGFLWLHENKLSEGIKHFDHLQDISVLTSSQVGSDDYPESDFLFVYRKCYWEAFSNYFLSEDHWFSSFYDVAFNHVYEERIYKEAVVIAGWDDDNVTKGGHLSEEYFRWAMLHRKHMLDNYKERLGVSYLNYTLRSYLTSQYLHKTNRKDSLLRANFSIKIAFKYLITGIIGYGALIMPFPKFFVWLKRKIFSLNKER